MGVDCYACCSSQCRPLLPNGRPGYASPLRTHLPPTATDGLGQPSLDPENVPQDVVNAASRFQHAGNLRAVPKNKIGARILRVNVGCVDVDRPVARVDAGSHSGSDYAVCGERRYLRTRCFPQAHTKSRKSRGLETQMCMRCWRRVTNSRS